MAMTMSVLSVRCTTLVDDGLGEQRRGQRDELDDQGGQQHLLPELFVFEQLGHKPAEAELARLACLGFAVGVGGRVGLRRDAGDVAAVARGKLGQLQRARAGVAGFDQQQLGGVGLQDEGGCCLFDGLFLPYLWDFTGRLNRGLVSRLGLQPGDERKGFLVELFGFGLVVNGIKAVGLHRIQQRTRCVGRRQLLARQRVRIRLAVQRTDALQCPEKGIARYFAVHHSRPVAPESPVFLIFLPIRFFAHALHVESPRLLAPLAKMPSMRPGSV
jgi:hypothetical protein